MELPLNSTPDQTMVQITQKMFNTKFLSDIQFTIDGKTVYAHSLELMKRSIVFQEQLESTMGEKKLIPISDYSFDSFYQFIRYCYTDDCTINDNILLDLFKLARNYKFIKLENKVMNFSCGIDAKLRLFEYSVLEKYQGLYKHTQQSVAQTYSMCLRSPQFLLLHPDAIESLLKFNNVGCNIRELEVFEALNRYMNNYCQLNGVDLADRRMIFDKHIRLIRFPVIRIRDLRDFKGRFQNLLTKDDFMTIGSQVTFDFAIEERKWNTQSRMNYELPVEWTALRCNEKLESKFRVNKNLTLTGLRFCNSMKGKVAIEFTAANMKNEIINSMKFIQELAMEWSVNFINLGEMIHLKTDEAYTLGINLIIDSGEENEELLTLYRSNSSHPTSNYINSVKFTKISSNLIELIFKSQDENDHLDVEFVPLAVSSSEDDEDDEVDDDDEDDDVTTRLEEMARLLQQRLKQ